MVNNLVFRWAKTCVFSLFHGFGGLYGEAILKNWGTVHHNKRGRVGRAHGIVY